MTRSTVYSMFGLFGMTIFECRKIIFRWKFYSKNNHSNIGFHHSFGFGTHQLRSTITFGIVTSFALRQFESVKNISKPDASQSQTMVFSNMPSFLSLHQLILLLHFWYLCVCSWARRYFIIPTFVDHNEWHHLIFAQINAKQKQRNHNNKYFSTSIDENCELEVIIHVFFSSFFFFF